MIYLDHASTTSVHPTVLRAMSPYFSKEFGNPSSLHEAGIKAAEAVSQARENIAACLDTSSEQILFTSGGTESDNLAFHIALSQNPSKRHIIVSEFEHPAVRNMAFELQKNGYSVTFLPISPSGFVAPEELAKALRPDTAFVSVMMANNEIGTIQPIRRLAMIAHSGGALFHTDAVQAFGVLPTRISDLQVDLLSASSHKIYGPKGVGFLYVSSSLLGAKPSPLILGGGQEKGWRSGTENVPGIVGFGTAAALAHLEFPRRARHLTTLRNRLLRGFHQVYPSVRVCGALSPRLPGNLNVCFENMNSGTLLGLLDQDGICASSGSACSASKPEPSHVLLSIGLTPEQCYTCVRFTIGIENTIQDMDYVIDRIRVYCTV